MIGPYLKQQRLKTDVTQAQLSRALKCKPQQVANIESGQCNPPKVMLNKWIKTIGVNKKSVVDRLVREYKKDLEQWI